jgi:hypothetical protein
MISPYTCGMKTRRSFITSAAVLGASAVVTAAPAQKKAKKPLIHHAIFWLKNSDSIEDRDKLVEGVKTLAGIGKIKQLYVGVVAQTEKRDVVDQSWGVSEIMFFDNLEDQSSYQTDLIHQNFIKNYSQLWDKVIVYDAITV